MVAWQYVEHPIFWAAAHTYSSMGGGYRKKRNHHARREVSRGMRTRARTLDHDQRHENVKNAAKRRSLEAPTTIDPDKAGLGMFYCIECDRHFPSGNDRDAHFASKQHKRIAKRVHNEEPYTQAEADRAAGIGVDNRQRNSSRIETED